MNSDYLTEWQYRYNPFKEREQKRLYYTNKGDQNGSFYPWAYYLLGLSREQYAVYNGIQFVDDVYKGIAVAGGGVQDCNSPNVGRNVYLFPTEYNVYSLGSGFNLSYKADENGQWQKHFKVKDHLGNERLDIIYDANSIDLLAITSQYDYDAFGDITWSNHINLNDKPNRLGYIGKEKDKENSLADHGVRKYDDEIGRFTSIDPLWEKYYSRSPYHYCRNNPVWAVDGNGMNDYNAVANPLVMKEVSKYFNLIVEPYINLGFSLGHKPSKTEFSLSIYKYNPSNSTNSIGFSGTLLGYGISFSHNWVSEYVPIANGIVKESDKKSTSVSIKIPLAPEFENSSTNETTIIDVNGHKSEESTKSSSKVLNNTGTYDIQSPFFVIGIGISIVPVILPLSDTPDDNSNISFPPIPELRQGNDKSN